MKLEGLFCLTLEVLGLIGLNLYLWLWIRRIEKSDKTRPSDPVLPAD